VTIISLDNLLTTKIPKNQVVDNLTSEENIAIEKIREALCANNLPADDLVIKRTQKYLTIGAGKCRPFCNLKMIGRSFYLELCICGDDIIRLSENTIYSNLKESRGKFTRFEIINELDIGKYEDGIISSYCWINPAFRKRKYMSLDDVDATSNLREFFGRMESFSRSIDKFAISDDEMVFFEMYIKRLEDKQLNWRIIEPQRMSDGAIKVHGGRIKLQGQKTYMLYTNFDKMLACTATNRSLSEYIELQKNWITACFKYRGTYLL